MAEDTPIRDWRLYWLARLDHALTRADRAKIQEARRNLSRLGLEIRFTLPIGDGKAVQRAN